MTAATRKLTARLRAALRRAAHITRTAATATLATSATTLVRRTAQHLAGHTTAQINNAIELIEDNAIHLLRTGIWLTVSTDGSRTHRTTTSHCTCEAGIKSRRCYHTLAARALEVA